ncbi:hypothetical protein D3C75_698120 [compost metagenome]
MSTKPTKNQEDSLEGMMEDIKNGLFEDFSWSSKEQAQEILTRLKAKVNNITVDEIFDEDE